MIVFSDLHLREETADTVFNDVLQGLVMALVTTGERHLVCLGDFWHLRYQVSVELQNKVLAFFHYLQDTLGVEVDMIPGNHDQVNIDGENALQIFDVLPNVRVHSRPEWTKHGLWIPYRKNTEEVLRAFEILPPVDTPWVVWMHQGFAGARMNNALVDKTGLPASSVKLFKVFCGHYHKRQVLDDGNIVYIGSPYQTRADEQGPKGYAIVNSTTWDIEFVDMDWGKKYHKLQLADLDKVDLEKFKPGDEVRLDVPNGVNVQEVVKDLTTRGVKCIPKTQITVQEQRLRVENTSDFMAYVNAYVDEFKGGLDKERLMYMYEGYVSEAN